MHTSMPEEAATPTLHRRNCAVRRGLPVGVLGKNSRYHHHDEESADQHCRSVAEAAPEIARADGEHQYCSSTNPRPVSTIRTSSTAELLVAISAAGSGDVDQVDRPTACRWYRSSQDLVVLDAGRVIARGAQRRRSSRRTCRRPGRWRSFLEVTLVCSCACSISATSRPTMARPWFSRRCRPSRRNSRWSAQATFRQALAYRRPGRSPPRGSAG